MIAELYVVSLSDLYLLPLSACEPFRDRKHYLFEDTRPLSDDWVTDGMERHPISLQGLMGIGKKILGPNNFNIALIRPLTKSVL